MFLFFFPFHYVMLFVLAFFFFFLVNQEPSHLAANLESEEKSSGPLEHSYIL